jgi:hypothetical protein
MLFLHAKLHKEHSSNMATDCVRKDGESWKYTVSPKIAVDGWR